ncbi:polysaccharide deacetylase family protein [Streptomyces bambusae]|uniref:polysaccharide deacetylase family protein n=1 Tax=Streptomyces bambusae TaxID=1550616 RepID=UPI001CFD60A7|nr:polysaccharide deacetylase family protein [Streptomyces bambusae]MCB5165470.1 polysaccharide deacetylase family protein [Streptomyces bambusae]
MKSEELIPGRRMVLRTAVFLGAAVASGLFTGGEAGTPGRHTAAAPGAGGPQASGAAPGAAPAPAPGPPQAVRPGARAPYRLSPMADEMPRRRPAKPPVRTRPLLDMPPAGSSMALTFDDGPDPRYTPKILDTLARHDVKAVFFVCGEMATEHRDLLRRMADEGHVIGNHTWTHPLIPRLSRPALDREIRRTSELVDRVTGTAPVWFRAPFGAWNRAAFEIGADLGMEPLAWTVDTLDWQEPGTSTIVTRVLRGAAPGVVVLSHDAGGDRSQSVAALRSYLPRLLERGYRMTLPALPLRD